MSKFQFSLLVIFGFFILVAVLVFAFYRGSGSSQANITIWGSFNLSEFNFFMNNSGISQEKDILISYVEVPHEKLETEFTEALARGEGPDLIVLTQEDYWKSRAKLSPIPYESISARNFSETFAEAGELFLSPRGVYALPLSIDPLILYFNRDLLSAASVAKPLAFWDEIYAPASKLTKRDAAGNITQSMIALGEARNIGNAKEILSLLFLQAGTPVTSFAGESLSSTLSANFGLSVPPADAALDFYTQFANPSKAFYSWNRTLPEAQTGFASGDVAYYLGFASEYPSIKSKSPTLNFAVAPVPQSRVSGKTLTFGRVYALAISRGSKNPQAAFQAALKLVSREKSSFLSEALAIPPARRDLLSLKPTDAVYPVFYEAALQARAWIDPDQQATKKLFDDLIDSMVSGRMRTSEAVSGASRKLDELTKK